MTDTDVHPEAGGDEAAKIWDQLSKSETGKPPTAETPAGEAMPDQDAGKPQTEGGGQHRDPATGRFAAKASTDESAAAASPKGDQAAASEQPTTAKVETALQDGTTTDTAAAGSATADPWASASPEQRGAFEATRTELEQTKVKLTRALNSLQPVQRKVADLQRRYDELSKKQAAPAAGGGDTVAAPKSDDTAPASIADDPKLKKVVEDFPDVAEPMVAVIRQLEGQVASMRKELGGVSATHRENNLERQFGIVLDAHPDYLEVAQTPQFIQWYEQAPAYVQAAIERNADRVVDGEEVKHVVKLFKAETGFKSQQKPGATAPKPAPEPPARPAGSTPPPAPDPKRKDQLESAAGTSSRRPPVATHGDGDSPEAIWKRLADEERRRASR